MIGSITVTNTGSGIDIVSESQEGWFTIQAQDAVNNTLTIQTSGATSSSTQLVVVQIIMLLSLSLQIKIMKHKMV